MKKILILSTAVAVLEIFLYNVPTASALILRQVEEPEKTLDIRISGGNVRNKDLNRIFSPDESIPSKSLNEVEDLEGNEAQPNSYASQCSIQQLIDGSYKHMCGCNLISDDTCMSSAHCMESALSGRYTRIICGVHNLNAKEEWMQVRDVHHWIFHPDYDYYEMWDDLCLVKTNSSFDTTGKYVETTKICSSSLLNSEDNIFLVGWAESNPDFLHEVKMNTSSFDDCAYKYIETAAVIESQSCFVPEEDVCFVDAGGIIFKEEADEKCVLALASYGAWPCGKRDWPSIYTNAVVYQDWIEETLALATPSYTRDSEF